MGRSEVGYLASVAAPLTPLLPPTIDASLGVGMVGGVKATFIALLVFSLCLTAVGVDHSFNLR